MNILKSLYHTMFFRQQQQQRHKHIQSQLKAIQSMTDKLPVEKSTCRNAMNWLVRRRIVR